MDADNARGPADSAGVDIAVVGATGAVGGAILELLAARGFTRKTIHPVASDASSGETVLFGNKPLLVEGISGFDFSRVGVALFAANPAVSIAHVARATEVGCVVIDCSGQFAADTEIPLVVYNVNPDDLAGYSARGLVAVPGAVATQLAAVLAPIQAEVGIANIQIATYQSVSGAGRGGIAALAGQTAALLNGLPVPEGGVFPRQIAFNLLPCIGMFDELGHASAELQLVAETRRLLADASIGISATCVQVPVFHGHALAVHLETLYPLAVSELRQLLKKAQDVTLIDGNGASTYPTPAEDASETNGVLVGRLRADPFSEKGLNLWIVSDNLRNGAAMNSVRLVEMLIKSYL